MANRNVVVPDGDQPKRLDGPGNKDQGWVQSDKSAHLAMARMGIKHPSALSVLHFMISKLNRGAGGIIISAPALARAMGISERTAKSAVAILRDKKFVQILKSGNTNIYLINTRVAWMGKRGGRYAAFNAQLIIDEQEQLKPVDTLIEEANDMQDVPLMEMNSGEDDDTDVIDVESKIQKEQRPRRKPRPKQGDLLDGHVD